MLDNDNGVFVPFTRVPRKGQQLGSQFGGTVIVRIQQNKHAVCAFAPDKGN